VIYDAVAGPGLEELVWATKRSGHVIVYGHLGAIEYKALLPFGAYFLRAINLHGSFRVFDFTGAKARHAGVRLVRRSVCCTASFLDLFAATS
jgi:NADPH:quinone reductase-like Zn-dependent oxidoreductase